MRNVLNWIRKNNSKISKRAISKILTKAGPRMNLSTKLFHCVGYQSLLKFVLPHRKLCCPRIIFWHWNVLLECYKEEYYIHVNFITRILKVKNKRSIPAACILIKLQAKMMQQLFWNLLMPITHSYWWTCNQIFYVGRDFATIRSGEVKQSY